MVGALIEFHVRSKSISGNILISRNSLQVYFKLVRNLIQSSSIQSLENNHCTEIYSNLIYPNNIRLSFISINSLISIPLHFRAKPIDQKIGFFSRRNIYFSTFILLCFMPTTVLLDCLSIKMKSIGNHWTAGSALNGKRWHCLDKDTRASVGMFSFLYPSHFAFVSSLTLSANKPPQEILIRWDKDKNLSWEILSSPRVGLRLASREKAIRRNWCSRRHLGKINLRLFIFSEKNSRIFFLRTLLVRA